MGTIERLRKLLFGVGYRETVIGRVSLDVFYDPAMRDVDRLLLHFGANHNYGPDSHGLNNYTVDQRLNRLDRLRDQIRQKELEKLLEFRRGGD